MRTIAHAIDPDNAVESDSLIESVRESYYLKRGWRGWRSVCFTYANVEVRFSENIMAGSEQFNEFSIDAVSKPDQRCIALPASLQPVRVSGWLGIGTSQEAVARRFKAPPKKNRPGATYNFEGVLPGCAVDEGGVNAWVEVSYTDGKVTHISGSEVNAC